jgi:TRAP-type C4-dicarboxylate transport system permease small subunit
MMARIVEGYFSGLKVLLALLLAAMVVLVFANVFLRYAFNSGITVSEELSRWFFVWLVFLGAIVGMREHAHIGMDTLVRRLPLVGRKICFVTSHLLMLYAAVLVIKGSWEQTLINWDIVAPASGLPNSLFYGTGVLFGGSVAGILVYELYRALRGELRADELIAVKESEDH